MGISSLSRERKTFPHGKQKPFSGLEEGKGNTLFLFEKHTHPFSSIELSRHGYSQAFEESGRHR